MDGSYNNTGDFKTVFYSPLGNYYVKGKFNKKSIEGEVTTSKGVKKDTIKGNIRECKLNSVWLKILVKLMLEFKAMGNLSLLNVSTS